MKRFYVAAVLLGAGLLFLVQPMSARMLLPLLGGAPAVWNTCLVFFQAALLLGYLYAHLLTVSVPPLARLLGTAPLDGGDWLILLVAVLWPVAALEVAKVRRARR